VAELLSINPNIETLVLQNTGIGGEGCMRIADALLGPHDEDDDEDRSLSHLDISKCDIHPEASKRLAAALASPHNRALVHLNMSSVYHTQSIGPVGVQTIAAALNVNRTLRSLDISGAEAGAAGIAALALSLRGGNGG
jgi:Ran GTPase-activating protein (RanGAP) involved in mRNA processing and transport